MAAEQLRLVVVGNGMAGIAAVEEVLKIRQDFAITVFGDERHVNYNRILLSDVLAGTRMADSIILNRPAWYKQHGIDLRLGVRVTAIDPAARVVTDATGAATPYDRLLLAVGGRPYLPPIEGSDRTGVFVFRTMEDCDRILARTHVAKQAVVIGGGLLGLEAARGLVNHGVSVTVVHLMDRLMEQQLDALGAALLKRELERMGIAVVLKATAREILGPEGNGDGNGEVAGVRLTTDQVLPAGMVVICAGIRPNLDLVRAAGLRLNRGVVVDDWMQTNDPAIYAVGDAIEHRGKTYGLVAPIPAQARVVAEALVGADAGAETKKSPRRYEGTVCATTLKVAGVKLTSAGHFLGREAPGRPDAMMEELVYLNSEAGVYKKLVVQGNRLTGMILLGDTTDATRLSTLILTGQDISEMKAQLSGLIAPPQAGTPADRGLSVTASMTEADLVCNCHTVTKGTICAAIRDQGLKSREEVASATRASTGCGSCASLVEDLVREAAPALSAGDGQAGSATAVDGRPGSGEASPPAPSSQPGRPGPEPASDIPMAYPVAFETERIKHEGLGLDFERIRQEGSRALSHDDYFRLKTYGVCSQKHPGYFMLRVRVPGGRVTANQLVHLADLAETHGRGWGHLTVRQDLEFHWVRVEEVPEIWDRLDAIGLTTRSACGHTMRNVTACARSGVCATALCDVQPWAAAITSYFLARSDMINPTMPSRLNFYFAGCPGCAPETRINDVGFVAAKRPGAKENDEVGFELWVGGSLGSHPILGFKLRDWIPFTETLPACQAIFDLYTKHGIRKKGKARLKFLIDQWGQERFTAEFARAFAAKKVLPENRAFRLPAPGDGERVPSGPARAYALLTGHLTDMMRPALSPPPPPQADEAGCVQQRQPGYVRMVVEAPMGEIRASALRALARVCRRYGNGEVHFNQDQDVELHWVKTHAAEAAARALTRAGLSLKGRTTGLRVTACPGTEFCVLAITDAQGAGKGLLAQVASPGKGNDPAKAAIAKGLSINISGCPNSCAKHQIADIGLAGALTAVGEERRYAYQLYLGGRPDRIGGGVQLGEMVRKGIAEEMIIPTVDALLDVVLEHRETGETFREVVSRLGPPQVAALLEERLTPFLPREAVRLSMTPELAPELLPELAPELSETSR